MLINTIQEPNDDNAPEFTLETMLFPNPAEKNCPIDEPHIIIFADDKSGNVYAMSMLKDIKPKQFSYIELQRFIKERWVLKGKFLVPQYMKVPDSFISEDNKIARDKKIVGIKPVLENLGAFLKGTYGKKLVANSAKSQFIKSVEQTSTEIYTVTGGMVVEQTLFSENQVQAVVKTKYIKRKLELIIT